MDRIQLAQDWTQWWTHEIGKEPVCLKMWSVSWPAKRPSASQEALYSMELHVSFTVLHNHMCVYIVQNEHNYIWQ